MAAPTTEHKLAKETELRLEVGRGKEVAVTLLEGSAEVFGAELALGRRAPLPGGGAYAVFTWDGATVAVEGDPDVAYVAEETPMPAYLYAHHAIHNLRAEARANAAAAAAAGGGTAAAAAASASDGGVGGAQGPRVVVAGPTDAGKSTLCRMLLNWAVRGGAAPAYADLDVGQGSVTAPGCLAATPVEAPVDAEEGLPTQAPLVFFLGHASPAEAPEHYSTLVGRLAGALDRRADASPEAAAAGVVVNTLGWVEGQGYDLLLGAVRALRADVVLVLEQDRLYSSLRTALAGATGAMGRAVQVAKLPRSGGIVPRPPAVRKDARVARVREYFYGPKGDLQPHSQTVPAEQLQLFKIGGAYRAPTSALPLGAQSKSDPLKPAPVAVGPELAHALLAVSHATSPDQLATANVAGFVLVTAVDAARGLVTYLAPCGGALPGRYLLLGSLRAFLD